MRFLFAAMIFINVLFAQNDDFGAKLSNAALSLTKDIVIYNPSYFKISYPNGDIPSYFGVCTDVVIRAYRKVGVDLQKEVHKDMSANFSKYPKIWGAKNTDKNIDHRRVPNLMKFFERKGKTKPITNNPSDYAAGDIVAWRLNNGMMHIGIVADKKSNDKSRNMIVHNIGFGQVAEDCLFFYEVVGHYIYK
jgi:uncharacterized protein YijF (DUF1287 family)